MGEGDAAEFFYVTPSTGDVTLLRSVLETERQSYKVLVAATDGGSPARTATATVEVQVLRDVSVITFPSDRVTMETSENNDVGHVVGRVQTSPSVTTHSILSHVTSLSSALM